ncbi:hypothetical protein ABZ801_20170 [Actinomadura sp. NPDC047616]|uniref:hypothetical protein n=1 Tax=Actinomadura sp. NPDC047616 TaxID=3155914 RepID=UPI0033FA8ABE
MIETYMRAYVAVRAFAAHGDDQGFALTLDNTDGHARQVLISALSSTRIGLLEDKTVVERHERRFRAGRAAAERAGTCQGRAGLRGAAAGDFTRPTPRRPGGGGRGPPRRSGCWAGRR